MASRRKNPSPQPSAADDGASSLAPNQAPRSALHIPLSAALRADDALGSLLQRLQKSVQRLDCVAPLLPAQLRACVRPGPLDENGWCLLVSHAAAAAKLRQMLPMLAQTLHDAGWPDLPIRLSLQKHN